MFSIRKQIHKGVKWTALSTLLITSVQIFQFVLLGKVMSLSEFGLVGILSTIIVFSQILLDLGLGSAVIQKEEVSDTELSTLFWLNVLLGAGIFLCLVLLSPLIAMYFHREELENLIQILSLMFLIAPIGGQSGYLLQKNLHFQRLGAIEVISNLISIGVLLILLIPLSPIYAYVISQVSLYSIKGILYFGGYYRKWRPSLIFNLSECRVLISFGSFQLFSRLVNRIGSNMDVLLIGRYLGAEALGIYNLAYQIVTLPVLKINPIITRVAFPVFSKNQQSNDALVDGYLHMTKLLSFVTFPMLMGLSAVSSVFVPYIFGQRWIEAVPIIQIMSIVGILRVLMNPNGSIILAKGKANIAFYWDTGVLIVYGLSLFFAVTTNRLEVVAWTYCIVSLVNFMVGRWLLTWLIRLSLRSYLKTIITPFLLSLFIAVFAYWIKEICIIHFHLTELWALSISVSFSAALYLWFLVMIYPQAFSKGFTKRVKGRLQ